MPIFGEGPNTLVVRSSFRQLPTMAELRAFFAWSVELVQGRHDRCLALPDWPGADDFPFDALGAPNSCSSKQPAFGLIDLTGEGRPALTITFACGEGGLGSERWWRFARDCD